MYLYVNRKKSSFNSPQANLTKWLREYSLMLRNANLNILEMFFVVNKVWINSLKRN